MGRNRAKRTLHSVGPSGPETATQEVSDRELSELTRARQQAQDLLLRARLEGRSSRSLAIARERAQRAADALLAARLMRERGIRMVKSSGGGLASL
jgi:Flp pilus assembly protein CpaB